MKGKKNVFFFCGVINFFAEKNKKELNKRDADMWRKCNLEVCVESHSLFMKSQEFLHNE